MKKEEERMTKQEVGKYRFKPIVMRLVLGAIVLYLGFQLASPLLCKLYGVSC